MFADRIENLKLYIPYNAKIKVVCDYLAKTDIHALEVGKYDIADGVRVVVNAFTPKTREAARWETHRKYIDLQYLIEGDESMGYLPIDEVEDAAYDAEKDVSATFDTITEVLCAGDKVQLVGFGGFETKAREARMGRNPKTKEPIEIPATTVPVFKPGKALKDQISK